MRDQAETSWLDDVVEKIPKARVAVFGDFCLDAYWRIDPDESECSLETGLPVRRVREQRYSLGGAGNVVANLAALGVGEVFAVGLIGSDLYGRQMLDLFAGLGIDTSGVLACQEDWQTFVYAKPHVRDAEQNRIDFGAFNEVSRESMGTMAEVLSRTADRVDVVILNQQIPGGLSIPPMIERINEVVARHTGCTFIVDSRHRGELYRGAILKVNSHEAARLWGQARLPDERVSHEDCLGFARDLRERFERPVFITRGDNGIVVATADGVESVPGIQVVERTDPVGAGDTVAAALAASLAVGADPLAAATLANIAASVTVRKIQTTGTASPDELRGVGPEPDYVYLPELADDPRQARYVDDREIEVVRDVPSELKIRHAIFDHDGTISTLRQGWEKVMEPMMIRAILGPRFETADEALYHRVVDRTRGFIDATTGIQTLKQMEGLIELVREFGCVAPDAVLDIHGYKALYNEALLAMVHKRAAKLRRGELAVEDFLIKNADRLLKHLHGRGVKLYLASGTDVDDVVAEAEAMGYADLFEGRIFGAVGDVKVEAKRMVLDRIIREHNLHGTEFVTFGDGPVEIRETHKRGGIAVGVASDEVRRYGLDFVKRARLIRAGADLIVPDYSQLDGLLEVLSLA
jgi:rfaE bifunctional protein kinase chain/domain